MLLEVDKLVAGYSNKCILSDVSISVGESEIVALTGHNGAGKTTLLSTIMGIIPVMRGTVIFDGEDISNCSPSHNIKGGLILVPQGIGTFYDLTVLENLQLVSNIVKIEGNRTERFKTIFDLFPILQERKSQIAGTLSGGERQMLSLAMSMLPSPKFIMFDEPLLGLAPAIAQDALNKIREINQRLGCGILIVDDNIKRGASLAGRVYVMKLGEIILAESSVKVTERDSYWELF